MTNCKGVTEHQLPIEWARRRPNAIFFLQYVACSEHPNYSGWLQWHTGLRFHTWNTLARLTMTCRYSKLSHACFMQGTCSIAKVCIVGLRFARCLHAAGRHTQRKLAIDPTSWMRYDFVGSMKFSLAQLVDLTTNRECSLRQLVESSSGGPRLDRPDRHGTLTTTTGCPDEKCLYGLFDWSNPCLACT
jgi:hypothetical protein